VFNSVRLNRTVLSCMRCFCCVRDVKLEAVQQRQSCHLSVGSDALHLPS